MMHNNESQNMSSRARFHGLMVVLAALAVPALAHAAPSADEIVNKSYCKMYYQGTDGRAQVHMTIFDGNKNKRERDLTILRRDEPASGSDEASRKKDDHCGTQLYYVYFHRPADVSKMSFLVWKHVGKGDDRWLYMPALDLVKRIAASDNRTSFFGSHFYYEDISGRDLADDTHALVETTKNYYVIKSVPKNKSSAEFAYYKVWVHRTSFLPTKAEYYDSKGKKYREHEVKKVETIQGYPTITQLRMSDSRIGGYTDITFKKVEYNLGLAKDVFSERYLRAPPKKHLQ
jgi:outer membrane lipoprotein-sorting protein